MKKRVPRHFKISVILCVLAFGALIYFLIINLTKLSPRSELVQSLYSYLGDNYLDYCQGMPFYDQEKVSVDTLNNEQKLCLAFKLINEKDISKETLSKAKKDDVCNITKTKKIRTDDEKDTCSVEVFTIEDLNKAYKKIFGSELKKYKDFELSGSKTCYYDEEKGSYLCGRPVVQSLQLGWSPTTYRMITKVKEEGNRIYIYDNYIAINNNKCYLTNSGNKENLKCSDKITNKTKYNSRFVSKYGQKYVHIFEKDSEGDYYWISSTPEKE